MIKRSLLEIDFSNAIIEEMGQEIKSEFNQLTSVSAELKLMKKRKKRSGIAKLKKKLKKIENAFRIKGLEGIKEKIDLIETKEFRFKTADQPLQFFDRDSGQVGTGL